MAKTDMYDGHIFGDWQVLGRFDSKKVTCKCIVCGFTKNIAIYSLEKGDTLHCKEHKEEKLKAGDKVGEWTILGKSKQYGKMICKCSCGIIKDVSKARLLEGRTLSCGHGTSKRLVDLKGINVNNLEVIEYSGDRSWKCRCTKCGDIKIYSGQRLRSGEASCTKCSQREFADLTGKHFGDWEVIEYQGNRLWKCKCSCGAIRSVSSYALRNGESKSCGHSTTGFKDYTGIKIGKLHVQNILFNNNWNCICECGNSTIKSSYQLSKALRENVQISCGCNIRDRIRKTRIAKYGEACLTKVNKREIWQIEALDSKENLLEVIKSIGDKPTIKLLSTVLNIGESSMGKYIHSYNLEDYITIYSNQSQDERDIIKYIRTIYNGSVIETDRTVISPYELDIYIPDKKIAIEYNGNYWHSDIYKNKQYHQLKSIECAKVGIRLMHIFEYEWNNDNKRQIIKSLLKSALDGAEKIYARNTEVMEVLNTDEVREFETVNHLQGYANASISIGMYHKNSLIGILTFGKPRFNKEYQYELIRLAYKQGISVVAGTERMFKYFINKYNPSSIITYCNLAKFNGRTYLALGFQFLGLSEPNYVYVSRDNNDVLTRYQTQKHRLVELKYGSDNETEDEIMKRLDYFKIYDSGNLKYTWRKN